MARFAAFWDNGPGPNIAVATDKVKAIVKNDNNPNTIIVMDDGVEFEVPQNFQTVLTALNAE